MQTITDWPLAARRRITGLFTDIDDTLTTDGAITPDALAALAALKAAGLTVIAITGRPVGWSLPFAASWPLDAVVAENGAVALIPGPANGTASQGPVRRTVTNHYQQNAQIRKTNYARMQAVLRRIEREIPGALRATDSAGRKTDIAIDHSEFTNLNGAQIAAVVDLMHSEGMHATVSSIHINGWYGGHNKLEGARWVVRQLWQRNLDCEMAHWVYVGDSTNDELMFEAVPNSIGVANIRRFETQLTHKPRYITDGERGAGFAEIAAAILAAAQA